jgi:hypothetical protein
MKKLNKLQINQEKLMKNDELITLKGGYGLNGYCCYCFGGDNPSVMVGAASHAECDELCDPSEGSWYC